MSFTTLNLQSFCTGDVHSTYSTYNSQPKMGFVDKFKKAISPKKGNELSRTASSRSSDFLRAPATSTPVTVQPFASNNPYADPSDVPPPPPYSVNSISKSTAFNQPSRQPSYTPASASASRPSRPAVTQADDNDKFAFLGQFDTVFLIDDSSSMSGPRWRETKAALESIVDICTKYDEDGIDIHFINKPQSFENVTSSSAVREIFSSTEFKVRVKLCAQYLASKDGGSEDETRDVYEKWKVLWIHKDRFKDELDEDTLKLVRATNTILVRRMQNYESGIVGELFQSFFEKEEKVDRVSKHVTKTRLNERRKCMPRF